MIDLKKVINAHPFVLSSASVLEAALKDTFPNQILDCNLALTGYRAGLNELLDPKRNPAASEPATCQRLYTVLVSQHGLASTNAVQTIQMWASVFGISPKLNIPAAPQTQQPAPPATNRPVSPPTPPYVPPTRPVPPPPRPVSQPPTMPQPAPRGSSDYKTVRLPSGTLRITEFIGYEEESMTIPSTINNIPVSIIGQGVFKGISGIKSISISDGIRCIEKEAFKCCSDLKSVLFPPSLQTIEDEAFAGCALESAVLPSNLQSLGNEAFANNILLNDIVFPSGLKTIGREAFYRSSVQTVVLPDSIVSIGSCAFKECKEIKEVYFPANLAKIESELFSECASLQYVYLPSALIEIGYKAFYNCTQIKDISFPSSLRTISDYSFYYTSVEHLIFNEGLKSIGKHAFSRTPLDRYGNVILFATIVNTIKYIYMPKSLTQIANNAFGSAKSDIYCYQGSYAMTWARSNGFPVKNPAKLPNSSQNTI